MTEFAKPFTLDGLFGAADAGAFGGDAPADAEMAIEADGEDAVESMDEDG